MGGWDDFLKNVRDGSIAVPIVGTYANQGLTWALGDDEEVGQSATGRFIEKKVLEPAGRPLEKILHGMAWAYDNGVSQPMSTFLLAGTHAENGNMGDLLSASAWGKAWQVANHVSPGQAFWADHGEVEEILKDRPLYATPPKAYLPPGWDDLTEDEQQDLLKRGGMPVVGNRAVEQLRRDSTFFKYASGAADFAARWWLDPTILAGKAIGAARKEFVVTPRPREGWSAGDLNQMMASSRMARAQEFIWNNRAQPDLINNLSMFKKSALGPRAGGIISQLKSPDEVALFLRTTLGDVEARAQLQSQNAAAAMRMEQDTSRLANLEVEALPRVQAQANPQAEAMVTNRMDELRTRIAADEDLVARYDATLGHYAELDALNLTRLSGSRAYARTANQRLFRTGPAMGSTSREVNAIGKTRIYASDMFGSSATFVRSFAEAHPNGLIAIDDIHPESVDELRGLISRIPGIGPEIRAEYLNNYLKTTTEGQRIEALEQIQGHGVTAVAQKHGLTYDEGLALYREYRSNITRGQEELRRYSGANRPMVEGETRQSADIFAGHDGRLKIHPNMVTKLANDQILIDLKALDTTLARHSSALSAIRTARAGNPDWIVDGLDYMSHLWKFATLFRLGYIPRVLSDDLLGQTARLGAATMAARAGFGVKNLATNLFHYRPASHYEGAAAVAREGMRYADEEIAQIAPRIEARNARRDTRLAVLATDLERAEARLQHMQYRRSAQGAQGAPGQTAAMDTLIQRLTQQRDAVVSERTYLASGANRVDYDLEVRMQELAGHREGLELAERTALEARARGFRQSSQLDRQVEVAPGVRLPASGAGEQGEYYMKLISSDDSLRTLLQRNKQLIHSNLQRSYNSKAAAPISYPGTEERFVEAWHKAINHQIMQDPFARMAVNGSTPGEMARWLRTTPQGRAYRKRLGITYDTPERIAQSVWHEVDEYIPLSDAAPGLREAVARGEADIDYLTEVAKVGVYPQYVHSTQLGEALAGSNQASRAADGVIDWWYKWAASLPADRMSRHPCSTSSTRGTHAPWPRRRCGRACT